MDFLLLTVFTTIRSVETDFFTDNNFSVTKFIEIDLSIATFIGYVTPNFNYGYSCSVQSVHLKEKNVAGDTAECIQNGS